MLIRPLAISDNPLSYPGTEPDRHWYMEGVDILWLASPADEPPAGRWPLLAVGSERDPRCLLEKLGEQASQGVYGFDMQVGGAEVVYPASVSSYGVCTSTLVPSEGGFRGWVHWLTESQIERLASSKGLGQDCDLYQLEGVYVELGKHRIENPLAWVDRSGPMLWPDGSPRRLPARSSSKSVFLPVSLSEAHQRISDMTGHRLSWPTSDPVQVAKQLAGGGIEWPEASRLNKGSALKLGKP